MAKTGADWCFNPSYTQMKFYVSFYNFKSRSVTAPSLALVTWAAYLAAVSMLPI